MTDKKKRTIQIAVTLGAIAMGVIGFIILVKMKPDLERKKPPPPVPVVRTIVIETGEQTVKIAGEGTVRPLREIALVPQVGGKVVSLSPAMVDGGAFKAGEPLVWIDPADYEVAVTLAGASVKGSESSLQMAEEDAAASREEWELLRKGDPDRPDTPPPLVAKEPQLAAAQARLEADRANLAKALLDLDRARITAPFTGRVSSESVDVGQYVVPGQALGTLYSTDAAEIVVPLESGDLAWIDVPGFTAGDSDGSPVVVKADFAGREQTWTGRIARAEGALDAQTRMVNVIVQVDAPYATKPPLVIGLFVTLEIEGRKLAGAAVIPRSALRQGSMVWIVDDEDRLRFQEVEIALARGDEIVISSGLETGDRIAVSTLGAITDGMLVRTIPIEQGSES